MYRTKQLVDRKAVLIATGGAGSIFLLLLLFILPRFVGGDGWAMLRLLASPLLGTAVLAPAQTARWPVLACGLALHYGVALGLTAVIAYVFHRWGLIIGVLGGAVLGLCLYAINIYFVARFWPQFQVMTALPYALLHLLFGAVAGGLYEWFETETFEELDVDERAAAEQGGERSR